MYISTNKYKVSDIMATTCTHMRHIINTEIHTRDISIFQKLFMSEPPDSSMYN